ncbi:MAG: MBL fold metallo-hydrolase, partial [Anaerovoracaceae bacterium]
TGGIPQFCRENQTAPIYIHKNAFRETYGMKNGQLQAHTSGIKWSRKEVESRLCLTEGLTPITENLFISGTIPQTAKDLQPEQFFEKTEEGSYRPDDMSHEQFLAIKEEGGIFVFSGCSHTGVVNTLNYVNQIFPGEPIKLLVAGMHLYACDKATRETVIDGVIEQNVHQIMPVHCTGIEGICTLKSKLGENCIIATAGDSYEY